MPAAAQCVSTEYFPTLVVGLSVRAPPFLLSCKSKQQNVWRAHPTLTTRLRETLAVLAGMHADIDIPQVTWHTKYLGMYVVYGVR